MADSKTAVAVLTNEPRIEFDSDAVLSQLNSLSTKFAKDKAKYEVKRVRLEVLLVADAFMQWSEHKNWSTLARVIEKHKHKSAAIKAAIRLTLPPNAEVKSEKGVIKIAVEGEGFFDHDSRIVERERLVRLATEVLADESYDPTDDLKKHFKIEKPGPTVDSVKHELAKYLATKIKSMDKKDVELSVRDLAEVVKLALADAR